MQITVNADKLNDTDLTPHVFLAHMRMIVRMKVKQLQALPATKAKSKSLLKLDNLISTKPTKPKERLPKVWYKVDSCQSDRPPRQCRSSPTDSFQHDCRVLIKISAALDPLSFLQFTSSCESDYCCEAKIAFIIAHKEIM